MTKKLLILLGFLTGSVAISGCAPAIMGAAAVGAGTAVIADKAVEEEEGGDGLF